MPCPFQSPRFNAVGGVALDNAVPVVSERLQYMPSAALVTVPAIEFRKGMNAVARVFDWLSSVKLSYPALSATFTTKN